MKDIVLERSIDVRCWHVIGSMSKAAKRDELRAVLLRARERGSTDAHDIVGHLLFEPNSRRIVAQRLLRIAELYGLLEEREHRYTLTQSGHLALATEQVFVPERGTWTIWASSDPLLPTPILRVESWSEPKAFAEIRGTDRRFQDLPPWLMDTRGIISIPLAGGGESIRIDSFEARGEAVEAAAELRAKWEVSQSKLRIEGKLNGSQVSTVINAPDISVEEVWKQLLESEGLWPGWDTQARALRVRFDETVGNERESLLRNLRFHNPIIEDLGGFEGTTVIGVRLRSKSAEDASQWANWRLRERIRDYATIERFRTWMAEALEPFDEFRPSMPSRRLLADTAWRERNRREATGTWHLVASEDWRL